MTTRLTCWMCHLLLRATRTAALQFLFIIVLYTVVLYYTHTTYSYHCERIETDGKTIIIDILFTENWREKTGRNAAITERIPEKKKKKKRRQHKYSPTTLNPFERTRPPYASLGPCYCFGSGVAWQYHVDTCLTVLPTCSLSEVGFTYAPRPVQPTEPTTNDGKIHGKV